MKLGCLWGFFVQSKLPPSTIIPPIELPWPPIHLVKEWTTIAAPCLIGLQVIGAAVLSTIRGIPNSLPNEATSSIGKTFNFGFGSVSA